MTIKERLKAKMKKTSVSSKAISIHARVKGKYIQRYLDLPFVIGSMYDGVILSATSDRVSILVSGFPVPFNVSRPNRVGWALVSPGNSVSFYLESYTRKRLGSVQSAGRLIATKVNGLLV